MFALVAMSADSHRAASQSVRDPPVLRCGYPYPPAAA
jgi:hypothetical protein